MKVVDVVVVKFGEVEIVEREVVELVEVKVIDDRAKCRVREERRRSITFSLRIRDG